MNKKYQRFARTRAWLNEIMDVAEWLTYRGPNQMRFALGGYGYYKEWKELEEWEEKYKQIQYLKQRKFLEAKKLGNRLMIRLTEKGYCDLLRDNLQATTVKCPEGYCVVIFDIPESERKARNFFRNFLKTAGFKQMQKSIWYSRKDVAAPLLKFIQANKLNPWIHVIVGKVLGAPNLKKNA